jgi:uncharacterized repeat protein (TIGR04076 family)
VPEYKIRCEVVDILKKEYNCARVGQTFTIGSRTPGGMCANSFVTVFPFAKAMRYSEKIAWEKDGGHIDLTCPDRNVVYRLTRTKE